MPVHHDCGKYRLSLSYSLRHLGRRKLLRLSINDLDGQAAVSREGGYQPRPDWWLNSGQRFAERLVDRRAAAGIDEQKIELVAHWALSSTCLAFTGHF